MTKTDNLHPSSSGIRSQVQIFVNAIADRKRVSPLLYGLNYPILFSESLDPDRFNWPMLLEAGVRMLRVCNGNNATKYNWQKKLTSHPDWYNNVYYCNWDHIAVWMQKRIPGIQGMWALPMIGKMAATDAFNFEDKKFNGSKWWSGVSQNLAGNGIPGTEGSKKAAKEGEPGLYLEDCTPETAAGILDHWFGEQGLKLNAAQFRCWNMDNEPDIWSLTHDDVMPELIPAADFMERYARLAISARAKFPGICLAAPVAANEFQWYTWNKRPVEEGGRRYCWMEYFIRKIAEWQQRTGIRMLDMLDIHFYPECENPEEVLQTHRVFFDREFDFPGATGVKFVNGEWNERETKEYFFGRCRHWLDQYLGPDHGVTLGMSEAGIAINDPGVASAWYASMLGEFMKEGVELFTPWKWIPGMWEVLHLFSRYNGTIYVQGVSSLEQKVSAYPTLNEQGDLLTTMLVNRSMTNTLEVSVEFCHFNNSSSQGQVLTISSLPRNETFISHQSNALQRSIAVIDRNSCTLSLPPLSVTSLQVAGTVME